MRGLNFVLNFVPNKTCWNIKPVIIFKIYFIFGQVSNGLGTVAVIEGNQLCIKAVL